MPQEITIHVTSNFQRAFRSLPPKLQQLATKKDLLFRASQFHRSLRTHKLKGHLVGFWSYSVNYSHRVLFRFINSQEIIYYDIGTHEIYR